MVRQRLFKVLLLFSTRGVQVTTSQNNFWSLFSKTLRSNLTISSKAKLTVTFRAHQQRHAFQPLDVARGNVPCSPIVPLSVLVESVDFYPPPCVRHYCRRPGWFQYFNLSHFTGGEVYSATLSLPGATWVPLPMSFPQRKLTILS